MDYAGQPFHTALRDLRVNVGLTQEQAASLLGVTLRTLQRWEADESSPRVNQVPAIFAALSMGEAA